MPMTPQITALIVTIASALGTGLVTLLYKIFEDAIDLKLHQWGLISEDKRKIADEVIAICAEAQEKRYKEAPEDERQIHIILNQLESMQTDILVYFVDFYNNWITTYTVQTRAETKEAREFVLEMMRETEKSRKELIKAIGIWKK